MSIVIIIKVYIQLAILVREDFCSRDLWEGAHSLLGNFLFHLIDAVKEEVLSLRFVRHILGLRSLYLCMLSFYLIKSFLHVLNVRILRLIVIFEKLQDPQFDRVFVQALSKEIFNELFHSKFR